MESVTEYERRPRREWRRTYYSLNKKQICARACERMAANLPRALLNQIRSRAKTGDMKFNLNEKDIIIPTKCPVTGRLLQWKSGKDAPTIDRIIPNKGYVRGNIAVISKQANSTKNNQSLADLKIRLANADARAACLYNLIAWLEERPQRRQVPDTLLAKAHIPRCGERS